MLSDGDERRSQQRGLGRVADRTRIRPDNLFKQLARQFRRRWKILGSIVVTALTTWAIYRVDESFTKDAIAFSILTVALIVYAVLTIRSDLELE